MNALSELKKKNDNIDFHLAVAGETAGEIGLNVSSDLDGSGIYAEQGENLRMVPVVSIDDIIGKFNWISFTEV